MLTGIVAAVDLAVITADEDRIGIVRVEQDRPHRQAMIGELDLFPMLAAISAAIGAVLRAGVNDRRVLRMHRGPPASRASRAEAYPTRWRRQRGGTAPNRRGGRARSRRPGRHRDRMFGLSWCTYLSAAVKLQEGGGRETG